MAEELTNPNFETNEDGWMLANSAWQATGAWTAGSVFIGTAPATPAYAMQEKVYTADPRLGNEYLARMTYYLKCPSGASQYSTLRVWLRLNETNAIEQVYRPHHLIADRWMQREHRVEIIVPNKLTVRFYRDAGDAGDTNSWEIDDVSLEFYTSSEIPGETLANLVEELRHRRRDLFSVKHMETRYYAALYRGIDEYPRALWRNEIDTSLSTVAETRRYSLAALGGLTEPGQVRRAWMDDSSTAGHDNPIGRYEIEDDDGALTLVLDEDPPEAGRTISVEYLRAPTQPAPATTVDDVDNEWLLARAMVALLLEADPELEPFEALQADLAHWEGVRLAREQELRGRRRRQAGKLRTRKWRL